MTGDQFIWTGVFDRLAKVFLNALATLRVEQLLRGGNRIAEYLNLMLEKTPFVAPCYGYPGTENDQSFQADFDHIDNHPTCDDCDTGKVVQRSERQMTTAVTYYGTIASGNQAMRHGMTRDRSC